MSNVASFRATASLVTDKKVNLIYGLNGTGKSTVSDFLYRCGDARFADCRMTQDTTDAVMVYNQRFVQDHFYESDSLKGIFSLSRENKAAEEKISRAEQELRALQEALAANAQETNEAKAAFGKKITLAMEQTWEIKTNHCGGDRVLEFCLEGFKAQKDKLLSHVLSLTKPAEKPETTIEQLKKDVEALKDVSAQDLAELTEFAFCEHAVESNPLLAKAIVGSDDSAVSGLIKKLENSDWVREGLRYVPEDAGEAGSPCPFCQEKTITPALLQSIAQYFDDSYMEDVSTLSGLEESYRTAITNMGGAPELGEYSLVLDCSAEIAKLHLECARQLEANLRKLQAKVATPSMVVELENTKPSIHALSEALSRANEQIRQHQEKIRHRDDALNVVKAQFWELMRWQYDQTVSRYLQDREESDDKTKALEDKKTRFEEQVEEQRRIIASAQRETVNTDQAVGNINAALLDLGIEDFAITKHSETLYRIARQDDSDVSFRSLSEGEKMIISFLYFCELCKGRQSVEDTGLRRVAVIDDPISSLSHVYVFNVGQLLRRSFFSSDRFSQVFVLTHSLYFFYELTDANRDRRSRDQKLFRMTKNSAGSQIVGMAYEDIQNDYQAYWAIINDPCQPPALLANCMRNVVEYFFNFVRRKDLNNVFQMPELQATKYQAFCRYVNRESHSLGQNILDMKEFDYDTFREGLRLVFEKTGYLDHYREMSKT